MNLKNYAELRSLTLTKVKALCKQVFDKVPSDDLTDEQVAALDSALAQASRQHLSDDEKLALPETKALSAQEQSKVIEIVGLETLKRNALIYQQILLRTFQQLLLGTQSICEKTEKAQAQIISNTYSRMGQNLMSVYQEFIIPDDMTNSQDFFSQDMTEEDKQSMLTELRSMGMKVD